MSNHSHSQTPPPSQPPATEVTELSRPSKRTNLKHCNVHTHSCSCQPCQYRSCACNNTVFPGVPLKDYAHVEVDPIIYVYT